MTTRELVVRMAAYFGGWPDEIWNWPFHYFVAVRREYLKIHGLAPAPSDRKEVARGVTSETYEY